MNDLQKFDELKAEISVFIAPILKTEINSSESKDMSMATAQQIKRFEKAVEKKRKEMVDPLNAQVKQINAYVKKILEPLASADGHLRKNLIAWENTLERQRREAQAKLDAERRVREQQEQAEAEVRAKAQEELDDLFGEQDEFEKEQLLAEEERQKFLAQIEIDARQKQITEDRVKGTQKVWSFELLDSALVPREFLIVDERLIRAAIKSGTREISGVKIFEETKISIRS